MMARGEVALIVTTTAVAAGLPEQFMLMTVLLILFSSILTPILLKVLYNKEKQPNVDGVSYDGTADEQSASQTETGTAEASTEQPETNE